MQNTVFMISDASYSNQTQLDLEELQKYVDKKFASAQFLWLKRVYVDEADKLARKARILYEKFPQKLKSLLLNETPDAISKAEKLTGTKLINFFKSFGAKKILDACAYFGTQREREVLNGYINNTNIEIYDKNGIIGLGAKKRTYIKFVYHMLPKDEQKKFLKYLKYLDPRIQGNTFPGKLKTEQKSLIMKSLKEERSKEKDKL